MFMRPPKDNFKKETEALNMINMQGDSKMLFKVFYLERVPKGNF